MRRLLALAVAAGLLSACASACVVDSDPSGATITVDGDVIGETPARARFSTLGFAQSYQVRAELAGYEPQTQVVQSHLNFWTWGTEWPEAIVFRLRPLVRP